VETAKFREEWARLTQEINRRQDLAARFPGLGAFRVPELVEQAKRAKAAFQTLREAQQVVSTGLREAGNDVARLAELMSGSSRRAQEFQVALMTLRSASAQNSSATELNTQAQIRNNEAIIRGASGARNKAAATRTATS